MNLKTLKIIVKKRYGKSEPTYLRLYIQTKICELEMKILNYQDLITEVNKI